MGHTIEEQPIYHALLGRPRRLQLMHVLGPPWPRSDRRPCCAPWPSRQGPRKGSFGIAKHCGAEAWRILSKAMPRGLAARWLGFSRPFDTPGLCQRARVVRARPRPHPSHRRRRCPPKGGGHILGESHAACHSCPEGHRHGALDPDSGEGTADPDIRPATCVAVEWQGRLAISARGSRRFRPPQ